MSRPIKITRRFLSPEEIRQTLGLSRRRAAEIQQLMADTVRGPRQPIRERGKMIPGARKVLVRGPCLPIRERGGVAVRLPPTHLIRHFAERLEVNSAVAGRFLDELAKTAIQETKKNGVFVLPGIGRLVKANRKARMGRNPSTGEVIKLPAKTVVKFRIAKSAKDAIVPGLRKK